MSRATEKVCGHCQQPIRKGEGYAETDIGTGKWVHWPACPPSARVMPEAMLPTRKKWPIEKYYVFKTTQKERPYQLQYRIEGSWGSPKDFGSYEEMREFMLKGEAELWVQHMRQKGIVSWQSVDVPKPQLEEGARWTQFDNLTYTLTQPLFCSEGLGLFETAPQWVWRISQWNSEKRESKEIDATEKKLLEGHYGFPAPGVEFTPEGTRIPPHHSNPEKICERCGRPIRAGEMSAETDVGSGKYVHWTSCPPSAQVFPEKTTPFPESEQKLWRLWFTTPMGFEAFSWVEAKTREEAVEEARKWVPEGSELRFVDSYDEKEVKELLRGFSYEELEAVARGTPCALEAYLRVFHTEKVPMIVQRVAENMLKGTNPGVGEMQLVDGLTLKDYYDLRDLRLLLWGLEKELVGKYGIIEAEPLASKVRGLIKKKIEQVTSKIGSSPEHHSNLTELPSIIYGGASFWRNTSAKDMWLPDEAVKLFYDYWFYPKMHPQQSFSSDLWKFKVEEVGGSVHLPAEHLGPIEKQGKYSKIYVYRTDNIYFVPVYFEHDGERYVKFVHLKVGASEPVVHHSSPVSREEAEAEINVLIDNLAAAIRKGGDIPSDLREALRKGFMFFKSNPGFPPQYTDFEQWLKKAQDMTIEQFQALPQDRKDFIYGLFKSLWGNPHPSASTGNPDGKFKVRFNEGTSKQEDISLEAPSPEAATIEAARKYQEKHGEYPSTARLVRHHSTGNPDGTEAWPRRALERIQRPPF